MNRIRKTDDFISELSIVAEENSLIVGHVLFSKVKLIADGRERKGLSLAPVAVLPEKQKHGIGRCLIEEGIFSARHLGFEAILVLGDPKYYARFGFEHHLTQKSVRPIRVSIMRDWNSSLAHYKILKARPSSIRQLFRWSERCGRPIISKSKNTAKNPSYRSWQSTSLESLNASSLTMRVG